MARNHSIDIVGGIMILWMIFRHCLISPLSQSWLGRATYYPLLFFMAWFFFKGGMFFRDEPVKTTFVKSIKRLAVPYLIYSTLAFFVSFLIHCCVEGSESFVPMLEEAFAHLKKEGSIVYNAPLWFLPSLFAARILFSIFRSLKIPPIVVAILSLGCAFGIIKCLPHIGLYFGNSLLGLFFFSLGFLLKDLQYGNKVFYASVTIYLLMLIYFYIDGNVAGEFYINYHKPFVLVLLFYLSGCITFNNLFKRFSFLRCSFLEKAGAKSMVLYVTHFIVIYNIVYLNSSIWHLSSWMLFGILCASLILTMPFVVKFSDSPSLRWTFGV